MTPCRLRSNFRPSMKQEPPSCALPPPLPSASSRRRVRRRSCARPLARQGARDLRRARSRSRPSRGAARAAQARYLADQFHAGGFTEATSSCPIRPGRRRHRRPDRALAGGAAFGEEGDPADGPYGRGRGAPRRLVARSLHARRGGRLFLRPRHDRQQAGLVGDHHRFAAPARRRLQPDPRHHRPLHRRRGDRRQRRRARRQASGSTGPTPTSRSTPTPAAAPSPPTARSLGFGIQTAEKIYQSFTFTATNPGGHSSRPRPDNAIYELAHTLERLEAHRFDADAERDHPRLFHPSREDARRRRSPPPSAAGSPIPTTARRPTRSRPRDRGRPHPHPLRRHPAGGRPCRQCAAAARPGDGQLPDLPRRRSRRRRGRAAAGRRAGRRGRGRATRRTPTPRLAAARRTWSAPTPPRSAPAIPARRSSPT